MGEDVELCLEVQVDPASKKILSNPDKCRSALLDVTVVKPKELEAFGTQRTNTLRADEVRKLITSMEKQRRKKQRMLDKLKDDDTIIKIRKHEDSYDSHHRSGKLFSKRRERISSKTPVDDLERKDFIGIAESVEPLFCEIRKSLKNVETRITNMQDINLVISQTTIDATASEEYMYSKRKKRSTLPSHHMRNQSVYRVETSPHDLKSVLCKNKKLLERGDRIEGKCLCENCGIVGLLKECQKRPLLPEFSDSLPASTHKPLLLSRKKETSFNLSEFDKWKDKYYSENSYIDHLSNRIKFLEGRLAAQEERVVPKDYFKKIITKMVNNFSPKSPKSKSDTSVHFSEKSTKKKANCDKSCKRSVKICTCKSNEAFTCCTNTECKAAKTDKATFTEDETMNGGYVWRWGEEILKPGIDLKNRIVTLLSEILSKLSLTEEGSAKVAKKENVKGDTQDSEIFKRFMKHFNAKVFNAQVNPETKFEPVYGNNFDALHTSILSGYKRSPDDNQDKLKTHHLGKENVKSAKKVDVSYVNPKLSLWRTESPEEKNNTLGRREFLKIVTKAKQHQKDVLWNNIWNQAKANGQTKKDKITIKIPCQEKDKNGQPKLLETEIAIGEVEEILKGV